jgi:tRNA 5-methylaminomethyl-2-thiouridine biosynthesis bifunctional protein
MPERVEWSADGTPRSARFDDIYRPAHGGLQQARHVFLAGCGLPQAWAGQRQWRILETGFGLGLNFLAAWRAWKDDPERPGRLHFVSIEAFPVSAGDIVRSAADQPELQLLAAELASRFWGLLPGFHRLEFEDGRVVLTLCIGDVQDALKQQQFHADSVFLDGFDPGVNPRMWELPVFKLASRLCRRGSRVATWTAAGEVRRGLAQCGFRMEKADGAPPKRHCLRGEYDPAWEPKGLAATGDTAAPGRAIVIGAGLAGAAAANSLARRGWQVRVLDAAAAPAAGASGLPAGLLAPHQSPDDNLLSRLSRAGVRITLQQAQRLLPEGEAWQRSGVLENRLDDLRGLPALGDALDPWTREAQPGAWWHEQAAWLRPRELVRAWLQHPAIERIGLARVQGLQRSGEAWQALGDAGVLAEGELVVLAAALDTARLAAGRIVLHPVRGQVSFSHEVPAGLPDTPWNGHGHFLPRVSIEGGSAWLTGSTYGRGERERDERSADHRANLERLRVLCPAAAALLAPQFEAGTVQAWTGVRCTSSDRRPLVGWLEPGLGVSTAMGSRGLTFAMLCAELLAAQLHGEPLPLERKLADALSLERVRATPS